VLYKIRCFSQWILYVVGYCKKEKKEMEKNNNSILNNYIVQSVKATTVKDWFLNKHYAKRLPMTSYCFALYFNKEIVGVCSFGQTPSIQLNYSLSNDKNKVIELNRLITNDNLPKNCTSFFVSQCLKKLPKPLIIVSFADISKNHNGYIYQATNWIYTGLNAERYEWKSKKEPNLHYRNIAERYIGIDKTKVDDLYKVKLSRKHRYVYFLGNRKDKKNMLLNMKYKKEEYPKGENKKYDASYKPNTQISIF